MLVAKNQYAPQDFTLSGIVEQRERQLFIGQRFIEEKIFNLSGSYLNCLW
jgi:hypothetical protein